MVFGVGQINTVTPVFGQMFYYISPTYIKNLFNRPRVAGADLQTPL